MPNKPNLYRAALHLCVVAAVFGGALPESKADYVLQPLVIPGATQVQAFGINNQGQVAGSLFADGRRSGFVLTNGLPAIIGGPEGSFRSSVMDVSDNGWIVGNFSLPAIDPSNGMPTFGAEIGFLFNGSTYETISMPGATQTTLRGISPDGDLVSGYAFYDDPTVQYAAFVLQRSTGTVTLVGTTTSGLTLVQGINANGIAAGSRPNGPNTSALSGFTFELASGSLAVDAIDGYWSTAFRDINTDNVLAGWLTEVDTVPGPFPSRRIVGFVGTATGFEILRISPTAIQSYVQGINDAGVAVGYGQESIGDESFVSFIATPVPEASSQALGSLGLLFVLAWTERQRRRVAAQTGIA